MKSLSQRAGSRSTVERTWHIGLDSGLGFQVKVLEIVLCVPSSLENGSVTERVGINDFRVRDADVAGRAVWCSE